MSETAIENATRTETKRTKGKAPKNRVNAKAAAPKAKPPKDATPKREKAPRESREGWGTFALKLPVPEREAFHKAAGPAGASRFARTVLVAFANEDEGAFKTAIAEARKLRA
jgi:hypothetical protein